jgi:DNA-binding NtrC family response regulator
VVDDDADAGEVAATNLRRAGVRVRTTLTADNALGFCQTQPFDAVVLDHHAADAYSENLLEAAPEMGLAVIVSAAKPSLLADIKKRHIEKVFSVKTKPVMSSELVTVVRAAVTATRNQRKQ